MTEYHHYVRTSVAHRNDSSIMLMKIDEFNIAYEKIGNGLDIVLFIPDALGTVQHQFQKQFDPDNDGCLDFD
ncbi:hypothetical protein BLA29_013974, partial [Euroglyphus maynei]